MVQMFRKIFDLLDRRERLHLGLLCLAVLLMAVLELLGIAAIVPFLSLASDPAQIEQNAWLARAYDTLGFADPRAFLVALGLAAFVTIVASNAWMAVTLRAQLRFSQARAHTFAVRLMRRYAAQPYVFFLRRNSAELLKNVLNEVDQLVDQTVMASLRLFARMVVTLAIVGLLVVFDPVLAIFIAIGLGGAYGLTVHFMRRKMHHLGDVRVAENARRYIAANELLGAIKEVKILGVEHDLLKAFERPSAKFTRAKAEAQFLGEAPRYVLEAVAFGGVILIAVYFLAQGGTTQQLIPVLGLYAFAGYRLMPSLQQIFYALMQLNFGRAILENIHNELTAGAVPALSEHTSRGKLQLRESLELRDISFRYVGSTRRSLQDITLTIPAMTTVGIIGPTGSGKTTLVDVILGLLQPDRGEILIDGAQLTGANLRAWQNNIGYVPQNIHLSDDTVARNIAFGVPAEKIDMDAVMHAAQMAQIHDFVKDEMAEGYDTLVGERGVRLSGGQHQRIGIARALYHDPGILIFDEATSALDTATEAVLMDAIGRFAGQKTIIIIAHRLETLKEAGTIVRIESGKLADTTGKLTVGATSHLETAHSVSTRDRI